MKITLTPKQTRAFEYLQDDVSTEILFGGGAGGAKSFLGCIWLIYSCRAYPDTRWVMGRAKLKTLKETTVRTFFEVAGKMCMRTGVHFEYNKQSGVIKVFQSEIILKDLFLYPSDPNFDSLGSLEITGAFIDECSEITLKAKNVLKSRIRYKLDNYGIIPKMLLTCNPAKNWVYSDFYKKYQDKTLPREKKFVKSLLGDNPHISKHYRSSLLSLDDNNRERLLYGNWEYDDDPATMVDINSINDIFTNTFVSKGRGVVSCDVARFGKDRTVIGVWHGMRCEKIIVLKGKGLMETAKVISRERKENRIPISRVIVDEDGLGAGLKDMLKCKGFIANSKPAHHAIGKNFKNRKSQAAFLLAKKINEGNLYCTDTHKDEVIAELEVLKRDNIDKDQKLEIIGKDRMKESLGRSPDFLDMMIIRMAADLMKSGTVAYSK